MLSTANKEASKAATQITPEDKELKKDPSVPRAKGKRVITIRKNTKGIMKVAIFLKESIKSLFRTSMNQLKRVLPPLMNTDPKKFLKNQYRKKRGS